MKKRILLSALAAALAAAAMIGPGLQRPHHLTDALLVVDITRSMNARDMGGMSRLDFARQGLVDWIATRPCGSRIGLAFFTERRSLTLFEPIEICADFASIKGALESLDWRMAWEGDSMIQKGLDHALRRAEGLGGSLIFVTDGQEAPPLPYSGSARFAGNSPGGLILGVGGDQPAPIPKFDDLGRETGFYETGDVQHAPARFGAPPPDASERPGWHPRNNPYGEADLEGSEHLSSLRADYLSSLAADRGLGFLRLSDGPAAVDLALASHAPGKTITATRSLSPILASAALVLLLTLWVTGSRRIPLTRKEST